MGGWISLRFYQRGPAADTLFAQATAYQAAGDEASAIIELKSLLQSAPNHVAARILLGELYLENKSAQAARKEFEKAVALGGDELSVRLGLIESDILLGRNDEAISALREYDTAVPRVALLKARAHLQSGDPIKAKAIYGERLSADPGDTVAMVGLARVALGQQQPALAQQHAQSALELDDTDIDAWLTLGDIAFAKNELDDARRAYQGALSLESRSVPARVGLASVHLGMGEPAEADEHLERLYKESPRWPFVNYLRAISAQQQQDTEAARAALLEVLGLLPNHVPSLYLLAAINFVDRDYGRVEQLCEQVLAISETNVRARKLLGAARLALGESEAAIQALLPAVQLAPQDGQLLALLGTAHLNNGEHTLGSMQLQRAVDLDPEAAAFRMQLAVSYLQTGSERRAISELKSAVSLKPAFQHAGVLLAFTHLRKGQWRAAEKIARELVAQTPDSPVAYYLLGLAVERRVDSDEATAAFRKSIELDPAFQPSVLSLADLAARAGQFDEAIVHFESVLEQDPANVTALVQLSRVHEVTGRHNDSEQYLERAVSASKQQDHTRELLIDFYIRRGDVVAAKAAVDEAGSPASAQQFIRRSELFTAAGELDVAQALLEELTAANPNYAEGHFRLGQVQLSAGDIERAAGSFLRARALDPGHYGTRLALGYVALQTDAPDEALAVSEDLRRAFPVTNEAMLLEGRAWLLKNDRRRALAAFEQAHERQPNARTTLALFQARLSDDEELAVATLRDWLEHSPLDDDVRLAWAQWLEASGDRHAAITQYQVVLEGAPNNVPALNNLASLLLQSRDERAIEYARRAYRAAPGDARVLDTWGSALLMQGSFEQAISAYRSAVTRGSFDEIQLHLAQAYEAAGQRSSAKRTLEEIISAGPDTRVAKDAAQMLGDFPN